MTQRNDKRRKLLKSIAAGGSAVVVGKNLPESWHKPVIDTVTLPAHAATTDDSGSAAGGAPTPPPCCLTAGSYCGPATNQELNGESRYWVMIVVAADGGIEAEVYDGCGRYAGITRIACTGGSFEVTADYDSSSGGGCAPSEGGSGDLVNAPGSMLIMGTIGCNATTITGTVRWGDLLLQYQANLDECKTT